MEKDKEQIDEEEAYRTRPQWFKFFYAAWLLSTASMDDQQKGWYITLLTWAASEGDIPGYLPDDEDELKQIAGMKDLPTEIIIAIKEDVVFSQESLKRIKEDRERRWLKVRSKFVTSKKHPGYVHNKRLVSALQSAYKNVKFNVEAGKKSVESRRLKQLKEKQLSTDAVAFVPTAVPTELKFAVNPTVDRDLSTDARSGLPTNKTLYSLSNSNKSVNDDKKLDSSIKTQSNELESIRSVEEKKKVMQTRFKEEKFSITETMRIHLRTKYPEFVDGDYDWLIEKFKNVYFGKSYISWSRTFYNFVNNQVTMYGYHPGDFNWRERANGTQPQSGKYNSKFETTEERHARLQREQDE